MVVLDAVAEHDQLFKWTFRVPEHAAGELRAVLPKELVDAIDFGSLALVQSDWVSQKLDERFSDALFSVNFGAVPGYAWLLLEHQSEPDRFMALIVLEYLVRSWGVLLRREPERKDLIPNLRIIVDDLVRQPDEVLKRRPLGALPQLVLWVLRDARQVDRLYEHLRSWAAELRRVMATSPEDAATVLRYVLMVVGDKPFDDFKQRIIDVAPEAEATMATIGEQLIQRGRVQGRAEGKAEGEAKGKAEGEAKGKADGVLAVLEARGLKLTAEQRSRIAGTKDLTQLDRWLRLAATASDAEGLFSH